MTSCVACGTFGQCEWLFGPTVQQAACSGVLVVRSPVSRQHGLDSWVCRFIVHCPPGRWVVCRGHLSCVVSCVHFRQWPGSCHVLPYILCHGTIPENTNITLMAVCNTSEKIVDMHHMSCSLPVTLHGEHRPCSADSFALPSVLQAPCSAESFATSSVSLFLQPNLGLVAENGYFFRAAGADEWQTLVAHAEMSWKGTVLPILQQYQVKPAPIAN